MSRKRVCASLLIACSITLVGCCELFGCSDAPSLPTPAVTLVHGDPDPDAASKRLRVLFLGDGFVETDLAAYKTAVRELTLGLLAESPFDAYADRLNVYRVDVLDTGGETKDGCTADTDKCNVLKLPVEGFAAPELGTPVGSGTGPLEWDFGAKLCSQGDDKCQTLGINAEQAGFVKRLALATEPGFDAVVIVANAQNLSGSAPFFTVNDIGIAVVGALLEGPTGDLGVSADAVRTFTHEFGHTLGLLDEEPGGVEDPPEPARQHNVWVPSRPNWRPDPDLPADPHIPWWSELAEGCDSQYMEQCEGRKPQGFGACSATSNLECSWHPSNMREPTPDSEPGGFNENYDSSKCIPPPEVCGKLILSWEGAYYHPLGHYRARLKCRMKRVLRDADAGFCEACRLHLQRVFCRKGENPGADCPPEYPTAMNDDPGDDTPQGEGPLGPPEPDPV